MFKHSSQVQPNDRFIAQVCKFEDVQVVQLHNGRTIKTHAPCEGYIVAVKPHNSAATSTATSTATMMKQGFVNKYCEYCKLQYEVPAECRYCPDPKCTSTFCIDS